MEAAVVGREGGVGRMDKGGERGKREGKRKEKKRGNINKWVPRFDIE
jgi:hypothetical protein